METLILTGTSKHNSRLISQLAEQLKFKVKKLTTDEVEEMGIGLSIREGLNSGILNSEEKHEFLNSLNNKIEG